MFRAGSPNYFTYVLAVSIDGAEAIDAAAIKDFLDKYYRGLREAWAGGSNLLPDVFAADPGPSSRPAPSSDATSRLPGQGPLLRHVQRWTQDCAEPEIRVTAKPAAKKDFLTLLISPQPPTAEVWKKLHEIGTSINFDGP